MRRGDGRAKAGEAGEHSDTLALVLPRIVWVRIVRGRVVRGLFRRRRGFVHAVARHRIMLRVGDGLFPGNEPGAMRRGRFHTSGEDESYGDSEAKADQPLDHADKMASPAVLSI